MTSASGPATPDSPGVASTAPGGSVRTATRWNALGRVTVMLIRWFVQVWLLKVLAVEDFGDMAVAVSFSTLLMLLSEFGTGQAVIQRREIDDEFLSTVFWLTSGLGLLLFGLVWASCAAIASVRGGSTLTSILPVLALSFAILSTSLVHRNLIARRLEFGKIAGLAIADATAYGVVAISLAATGAGVWALVFGTGAGAIAATITTFILSGWRPKLIFRWAVIQEVWSFSVNILGSRIADHVFLEADRVVLYTMVGPEATGYYFAAQQLVIFPIATITQVLAGVLVPALARLQSDLIAFRRLLLRSLAGIAFVVSPLLFGLAAVLEPTINGFLNDPASDVQKWSSAIVPALVLVPAALVRSLFIAMASVYVATGHTKVMLRWTLVLGTSLILSYLVGAWTFGLIGVAAGYTITHLLLAPKLFQTALGLVDLRLRSLISTIAPTTVAAAGMALLAFLTVRLGADFGWTDRLQAVFGVAAGVFVYAAITLVVRPAGSDDLLRLVGLESMAGRSRARENHTL